MRTHFLCALITALFVLVAIPCFTQDTNFANGPQYLGTSGSRDFARSISTPAISLPNPVLQTGASDATANLVAGADNQTPAPYQPEHPDLFPIFYGPMPSGSTIEISSPSETPASLPPSILDLGVWQIASGQFPREYGYGESLAQAAAANKARTHGAGRVYTNADIERLNGGE